MPKTRARRRQPHSSLASRKMRAQRTRAQVMTLALVPPTSLFLQPALARAAQALYSATRAHRAAAEPPRPQVCLRAPQVARVPDVLWHSWECAASGLP